MSKRGSIPIRLPYTQANFLNEKYWFKRRTSTSKEIIVHGAVVGNNCSMYLNIANKERNERIGTLHNITHILKQKLPSSFFSEIKKKRKRGFSGIFYFFYFSIFIRFFSFDYFDSFVSLFSRPISLDEISLSFSLSLSHTNTHTQTLNDISFR